MRYSEFSRRYPYYREMYDANGNEYQVGITAKYTPATNPFDDDSKYEDLRVFNIETGEDITHTMTPSDMEGIKDSIRAEHDPHHGPGL